MPGEAHPLDSVPTETTTPKMSKNAEGRLFKTLSAFNQTFSQPPHFYVRVPGRVNLIGEHVDYCGYGVFPMAIFQDVVVGVRRVSTPDPPTLTLVNTDPANYPPYHTNLTQIRAEIEGRRPGQSPPWHLYFLCGVLGVLEELDPGTPVSMELVVDGTVPPRAGLSSSSALVCAAALATLHANNGEMGRKELAGLCARSERFIGTQGGGMDQAIAFLATPGTAQYIQFEPELKGEKIPLPANASFVIANSLAEANKAASEGYNVRVAECRLATWILAKASALPFNQFNKVSHLQHHLNLSFAQMTHLATAHIHPQPYTLSELALLFEMEEGELKGMELMNRISMDSIQFKPLHRILHVLQEAERVERFRAVCKRGAQSNNPGGNGVLEELGELMNASHASLRDNYDCSHPDLETLVDLSAPWVLGVRLTGAGWGGCVVALVEEDKVQPYLHMLQTQVYKGEGLGKSFFVSTAAGGASILTPP